MMSKNKKNLFVFIVAGLLFCWIPTALAENRNIVKLGSDLTIEEGTEVRNAFVIGGQITVDGSVENHIISIGGSIVLSQTAVVGGNAISIGGIVATGKGADIRGKVMEINLDNISEAISDALSDDWEGWSWISAILSLFIFIVFIILTLLIVRFIPKPLVVISTAIRDVPFKVLMWGVGGLVLIVPLALLLTISVIGIALIPVEMTLVLCAITLGFIAVSQLIGEKLFAVLKRRDYKMLRKTIWGLALLWIIGWIPYVGWLLKVLFIVLGLGGVIVTRFGTSSHR
jgi:hypothetical protein